MVFLGKAGRYPDPVSGLSVDIYVAFWVWMWHAGSKNRYSLVQSPICKGRREQKLRDRRAVL